MDMKQVIYDELCRVAKANNEIAYYSELARLAGLDMSSVVDRNRLSDILGEINIGEDGVIEEDGARRPMLSAVALLKAGEQTGRRVLGHRGTLGSLQRQARTITSRISSGVWN